MPLDMSLSKSRVLPEISLSAFSFIFAELVAHCHSRVTKLSDLQSKLEDAGHNIGTKVLELVCFRERRGRRDIRIVSMLQFITGPCWKMLFGKSADALEKSTGADPGEYMIYEAEPVTNKFISIPPEFGSLNIASFIAGIIRGILTPAGYPATVRAMTAEDGNTVFLINFEPHIVERENML